MSTATAITQLSNVPSLSVGSLSSYIQWVNQIPLLSEEEEKDLGAQLREKGDLEAARRLVLSHLRFVVKIARGYLGYGLPEADLIQEGNIGLMKAVKRFDPSLGVRLVSFAVHWIRAEIHEFIIRNWRIVKIATTKAQRKLFFNLRKFSKQAGWLSSSEVDAIAEELNVHRDDVLQMEARLKSVDESLEGSDLDNDGESDQNWKAPIYALEDKRYGPDQILEEDSKTYQEARLHQALTALDDRSREIIKHRWLTEDKKTLQDLAEQYNISMERVRQLESNAMKKLKVALADAY